MVRNQVQRVASPLSRVAVTLVIAGLVCETPGNVRASDYDPLKLRRAQATQPNDTCELADNNLRRAAESVLTQAAPSPSSGRRASWNHRDVPRHLRLVEQRLALNSVERRRLFENGFVVLERPVWARAGSFARLFHDIYQAELPLYVSVDAILNAIYLSNDALIKDLEAQSLRPLLVQAISAMYGALPAAASRYPREVARDLDLYLTVAQSLLSDQHARSRLQSDTEVASLLTRIKQAESLATVQLFGRPRVVDFSQFTPRGHYATAEPDDASARELAAYFRAAMWLSRIEWNLVSRACRSSHPGLSRDARETPREAQDALALADLAQHSGALPALDKLDRAFRILAGVREDVGVSELLALRERFKLTGPAAGPATEQAATALRAAIGDGFRRTVRQHYMPPGSDALPVIATLLGPRIVADAQIGRPLVHAEVPDRYLLQGLDLAYALGHDRARHHLEEELARFANLGPQLERARTLLRRDFSSEDLYGAWLRGVRAISAPLPGATPSFMDTPAFSDLRLNTALAGLGQLRHNYVLLAAQSYSEGGCQIPDAYLDPAVPVYDALIEYATRGAAAATLLDAADRSGARAYFSQLQKTLQVLRAIALAELANQPLSSAARSFLGMVAEMTPESTGREPTFTGWYFDLFRRRQEEALKDAAFITDIFTAGDGSGIAYLGARPPTLGIFVIDTGGPPRLAVGPVATAYQARGAMAPRLSDSTADQARAERPWAKSYSAAPPVEPSLSVDGHVCEPGEIDKGQPPAGSVTLTARARVGPVTVELIDHHYARVAGQTRDIGPGTTRLQLMPVGKNARLVQGIAVRAGAWSMRWLRGAMSCSFAESYGKLRQSPTQ
jgi:hypothetical protein